jgi:hypothetical protein
MQHSSSIFLQLLAMGIILILLFRPMMNYAPLSEINRPSKRAESGGDN